MSLRGTHKINAGFSMSSMTDLVFLLLIFFVIVSTLVSPYALPVDLPRGQATTPRTPAVAIRINAAQNITVNNTAVSEQELETVLRQQMAGTPEEPIAFHVDQSVPTGLMVTVLDIAKRNRWKIALATKPEGR
jgi:biopolymer transport protein ExbD